MPFLLAEILNFQGSTHRIGVGSFSKYIIFFSFFAVFVNPFQNLFYVQICKVCCVDVENSITLKYFKPVGVPKSLIFIVFFCIIYLNSLNKKEL